MDGDGNADADIERIGDGYITNPSLFWKQGKDRERHGERDSRMR